MNTIRLRVLTQVERHRHRYEVWRVMAQLVTIGILFGVPLSGLARVDLYGGQHRLLFRAGSWREGLAGVIVAIALLYVFTFLINIACGRMFCGWGCPVGFLNRLCDVRETKPVGRARWKVGVDRIAPQFHSGILVLSCMLWWTTIDALWSSDVRALALAWGTLLGVTFSIWALGHWARWKFCMTTCPIGLYYSFVAPSKQFGVFFREATPDGQRDACLHCDACIRICPVDLDPMNLADAASPRGGIAIADAPGANHCLKCGDCIQACEFMIDATSERRGIDDVPLALGFFHGAQRIERASAEDAATEDGDTRNRNLNQWQDDDHPVTISADG